MATRGAVETGTRFTPRTRASCRTRVLGDDQVTELRQALERRGGKFDR